MKRRRSLLIAGGIALAALVALGALVVVGSRPEVCGLCHGEQVNALAQSQHASTGCYRCHLDAGAWSIVEQKGKELFRMYPKALVGMQPAGPVVQTARQRCLDCHAEVLTAESGTKVTIAHRTCAPDASCDGCHVQAAHPEAVRWATGPQMSRCVACHTQSAASIECASCHTKSARLSEAKTSAFATTHGANWQATHGMGDLESCRTCHPEGFCAKCHRVDVPHPEDFGRTHGKAALQDGASCESCHRDGSLCNGCHQMDMPHPRSFTSTHAEYARGTSDPRCFRCHVVTDCDTCHTLHIHPGGSQGVPVPWTFTNEDLRAEEVE